MRITQKTLWDYDELIPEICKAAKADDIEFSLMLISAKADIERTYGSQCANYSVLVCCYENAADEYKIVPHDYQL